MSALDPTYADTAGGTKILVQGSGFRGDRPMHCLIADSASPSAAPTPVPARFINSTVVECTAPQSAPTECEGTKLSLQFEGTGQFVSNIPLFRTVKPTILQALPDRSYFSQATPITLRGYGFTETQYLMCDWLFNTTRGLMSLTTAVVSYSSSQQVSG